VEDIYYVPGALARLLGNGILLEEDLLYGILIHEQCGR